MRLFRRAGASFSSDHGHGATSEQIRIGIFWSFFKKTELRKYARLIARKGVNVQKGQSVIVCAELEQPEFAVEWAGEQQ